MSLPSMTKGWVPERQRLGVGTGVGKGSIVGE